MEACTGSMISQSDIRRCSTINLFKPKRETWIYRVNPAFKFANIFLVLGIAFFNRAVDFALYQMIVYLLMFIFLSGFSWKRILLFTAPFIMVFISSVSTLMLFGRGETIWWQWGLVKISEESFHHGLLVGFKTVSFGALGLLFALTTKPILLFYSMMQQFRLPPKYAYSFIASIRIFPLVWEDFHNRKNALSIRGTNYAKGLRGVYERLSIYAVPLLVQSIRRAQRVAIAMEAKRFQVNVSRTYYYKTSYTKYDVFHFVLLLLIVVACYVFAKYLPTFGR